MSAWRCRFFHRPDQRSWLRRAITSIKPSNFACISKMASTVGTVWELADGRAKAWSVRNSAWSVRKTPALNATRERGAHVSAELAV